MPTYPEYNELPGYGTNEPMEQYRGGASSTSSSSADNPTGSSYAVGPELLQKFAEAGFQPAIDYLPEIIAQLNNYAIDSSWRRNYAANDPKLIIFFYEQLSSVVRESLLRILLPQNRALRSDLLRAYPAFTLIFNKDQINIWVDYLNKAIKSDGYGDLTITDLKGLITSFSKDNKDFEFTLAGNFVDVEGFDQLKTFENTDAKEKKAKEAEFGNNKDSIRPNSEPSILSPWECRIGLSRLFIPPTNISVSQGFKVNSMTGSGIRQKSSPKFNSGHSETIISMTIYYPNQDTVWGIGREKSLDIDFNKDDDDTIDLFASSLRGLITQFKYAPFLPIKNAYINQAFGITGVVMDSMTVSSVPDYPFCFAVNLNMKSFNHKVYLPVIDDFSNAIHWGRYRQYIGRAAEKMSQELYSGFLTSNNETVSVNKKEPFWSRGTGVPMGETAQVEHVFKTGERIVGFNRNYEIYGSVDRRKAIEDLAFYYPKKTPLQVFAPDMSDWRQQGENDSPQDRASLWQGLLEHLGIDVDNNPDAIYEKIKSSQAPIPNKALNNFTYGIEFLDGLKNDLELFTGENLERYKERALAKAYPDKTPSAEQKDVIEKAAATQFLSYLMNSWLNTPFGTKYNEAAMKDEKYTRLNEFDMPMEKFIFDNDKVTVTNIAASMSNSFATLQVQMQDEPAYQHLGSGDSQFSVSMVIQGTEELAKLRRLFDHINGLARLEYAHGAVGFLGVSNIVAGLCGIKYVMPTQLNIDTIDGYPNAYNVSLGFVDFDLFQQKREELSTDQQEAFLESFSKANPFFRLKQMWGATNCYPDMPLSLKDEKGNILGHLDPDFYFRSFKTIDDSVIKNTYDPAHKVDLPTASKDADYGNVAGLYNVTSIGLKTREQTPVGPEIGGGHKNLVYTYTDGSTISWTWRINTDGSLEKEYKEDFKSDNATTKYKIFNYEGEYVGEKAGNSKDSKSYKDNLLPQNSSALEHPHNIDYVFPYAGETDAEVSMMRVNPNGVSVGYWNTDTNEKRWLNEPAAITEDHPARTIREATLEGNKAFGEYNHPLDNGSDDPRGQYESMMVDSQYRDLTGRMIRAFPTYMLWLIDEGGNFAGMRLYDNFYGLASVIDFSTNASEDNLGDTLVLRLSNMYQKLSRTTPQNRTVGGDSIYRNEEGTGLFDMVSNRSRNILSGFGAGSEKQKIEQLRIGTVRLKPGVRVHMRVGYSANPNALPTVFNGTITQVEDGEIVTVTAQSDAIELSALVNSTDRKGSSGKIDGGISSGLWLSEPRDLMVRLLSMGSSSFKEGLAYATQGLIFSESKFGIRHFGYMLHAPLNEKEQQQQLKNKDAVAQSMRNFGSGLNDHASNAPQLGFGAWVGNNGLRNATVTMMGDMWTNFFNDRDYEIFKRNIYPGNGTGVAQFLGGDMLDAQEGDVPELSGAAPTVEQVDSEQVDNSGFLIPSAEAIDIARNKSSFDGSYTQWQNDRASATENNNGDGGIFSSFADNPVKWLVGGALAPGIAGPAALGVVGMKIRWKNNPILQAFGIEGKPDDDIKGFDEISFRAQTYMKTVWDLFKVCANLLPNYIVAVRPFEDRSTVFYGKPHWLYTSGLIPLTTGIPKDGLDIVAANEELAKKMREIAKEASPFADFEKSFETLKTIRNTTYANLGANTGGGTGADGGMAGKYNGENVNRLPLTYLCASTGKTLQLIPERQGKFSMEMHLPAKGEDVVARTGHKQHPGLPEEYKWPGYMDPEGGKMGGYSGFEQELANQKLNPRPGQPAGAFVGSDGKSALEPLEEQYYIAMRWPYQQDGWAYPRDFRKSRIIAYNNRTQKAVIVTPGDYGPHGSIDRIGGLSPDAMHVTDGKTDDVYTVGFVGDDTELGPVASVIARGTTSATTGEGTNDVYNTLSLEAKNIVDHGDVVGVPEHHVDKGDTVHYQDGYTWQMPDGKQYVAPDSDELRKIARIGNPARTTEDGSPGYDQTVPWFIEGVNRDGHGKDDPYQFAKDAFRYEKFYGATDPNVEAWTSPYSGIYPGGGKEGNIGHAARLLYDREYSGNPQYNSGGPLDILGDPKLGGNGSRGAEAANQIWKDLRREILRDDDFFRIFFADKARLPGIARINEAGLAEANEASYTWQKQQGRKLYRAQELLHELTVDPNPNDNMPVDSTKYADGDYLKVAQLEFLGYIGYTDHLRVNSITNEVIRDSNGYKFKLHPPFDDPVVIDAFNDYQLLINTFLNFLWASAYNRAWVVVTADKIVDKNKLPGGFDWDSNPDAKQYEMNRCQDLFAVFIDEYGGNHQNLQRKEDEDGYVTWSSESLFKWMTENNQPGNNDDSPFGKALQGVENVIDNTIGPLITATSMALSGAVNLFRTTLMQLGYGLSMAGDMQRQANVLNAMLNDSIYYSAGPEGSLLRMADNPFTREYGEPVVEIREPFQRIHYIDSFSHILSNNIQENLSGVYTKVTATSDGKYPVTAYLDKGIPANLQQETTVETGIYWDNAGGKGFFSILHPFLHPIETARGITKTLTGSNDELLSRRIALAHLKESLKDMYGGEIFIIGDPDIRPHDLVFLGDVYTRMYGMFEVEQVTHHFTPELGFITSLTPNAVVSVNDPTRWTLISWAWSRWAVHNTRSDARRLIDNISTENSLFERGNDVSVGDLQKSLAVQIAGHTQYTQGSASLVKDVAGVAQFGFYDYAKQKEEEQNRLARSELGLKLFSSVFTGGLAWRAYSWVRDNLQDQQGCYIQMLNKDGVAMDAGLSYAQGVAVGRHHSTTILPGILGIKTNTIVDGNTRITRDDLLASLGWSEVDTLAVKSAVSWWEDKLNSEILRMSGQNPDPLTFSPAKDVFLGVVENVVDGDTIVLSRYQDPIPGSTVDETDGSETIRIRLLGVNAPELLYKDQNIKVDNPSTLIDERTFNEVDLNSPDNKARIIQEYLKSVLIDVPNLAGLPRVVAVRINPDKRYDDFGRTLGVIFHQLPTGSLIGNATPGDILYRIATKWPLVPWDSYMDDGRPYTINWQLIMTGLAETDFSSVSIPNYELGAGR